MKGKELEIEQFNVLNYLSSGNVPKDVLELDGTPFTISKERIEEINGTVLTAEAVSYIDDKDDSIPRAIQLIDKDGYGHYFVTNEGQSYLEYFRYYFFNNYQ